MPKISLKKDYTDGSVLYGKDLNPNFELIETTINANEDASEQNKENLQDQINEVNNSITEVKSDLETNYSDTASVDLKIKTSASNTLSSSKAYTNEQLTNYATKSEIPTKISQLNNDDYTVKDASYVHTDNNYTNEDKSKLSTLNNYELPTATSDVLGGVKIGDGLEIEPDGKVNVVGGGGGGTSGEDGATFTPSVSEEGVLSWTNDKDLPNPEPVNIKGLQGEPGVGVPTGGTIGQVLSKNSDDDYDTSWIDVQLGGLNIVELIGTSEEPVNLSEVLEVGIYKVSGYYKDNTNLNSVDLRGGSFIFYVDKDSNGNTLQRYWLCNNGFTIKTRPIFKGIPNMKENNFDIRSFASSLTESNAAFKIVSLYLLKDVVGDKDISDLQTTDKSSLVSAINELIGNIVDNLDDNSTTKAPSQRAVSDALNQIVSNSVKYLSGTTTITYTPEYNCYIDLTGVSNTWGFDGGDVIVSISNTKGNATEVLNCTSKGSSGNTLARSLVARAVYACDEGVSYTFKLSADNSGGSNGNYIVGQVLPR